MRCSQARSGSSQLVRSTAANPRADIHHNPHRAVLFDVDGVLLDSMPTYRRVWTQWSTMCGLDPDIVWEMTPGTRPADIIRAVAPHLEVDTECRRLTSLLDSELNDIAAMPGAHALLTTVPTDQWALVTSNTEAVVRACFARLLLPTPRLVVDGTAVDNGKPHPEGFLTAAAALNARPEHCLVVEDAPAGVAAARAAGMIVFAINSNGPRQRLARADRIFPSLNEAGPEILTWLQGPGTHRPVTAEPRPTEDA